MSDAKVIPVRVALRTRPLIQKEIEEGSQECLQYITEANQVIIHQNKAFTFDYIFNPQVSQANVYKKAIYPLIEGIFAGYNGTVLAYGQTGSGKTYTMGSAHCVSQTQVTDDTSGIIPRVIKDIFEGINARPDCEFLVKVGYVEIYKEDVKDLLTSSRTSQNLNIRENQDGSIQIVGLTEVMVSSPEETLEYMEKGNCARSVASTAMNATSSRSHAIFTIILESRSLNDPEESTCSKFHLVDLAGSERAKRTKAKGDRLQEGIKINAGLLALGNVINALGEDHPHIPYRVSKLTRLLQDSLGGNSLTVMIACASPADSNVEETLNTLRYADRARKIKNKAIVNRDPQKAEMATLRKEVQQLRLKLLQTQGTTLCVEVTKHSPELQSRVNKLEVEKEELVKEMHKLLDSNAEMCEKVISIEMTRDLLCTKLQTFQDEATKVTDDAHNISVAEQALMEDDLKEMLQRFRSLRNKLMEVEVSEDINTTREETLSNGTQETICDQTTDGKESSVVESENDKTLKSEHILRTAKMANQLQDLNKALAMKEELAKRMCSSEENIGAIKYEYESRLAKLDSDITELQAERDGLMAALEAAKKSKENHKLSEQRRIRLLDLENQIKTLKNEKKEKEKVKKLKAQGDEKITRLNSEIHAIKTSRVKLMKQIKEESSKYQQWKKEKEREVKQLKEKDRKRQYEIVRLERDYTKQKNVLRRKTEEAAASNRRLKEALGRQQSAAAKRQQPQSRVDAGSTKMKAWLEDDIEIAVCSKQAKRHYDILEQDLKDVRGELEKTIASVSPSKRRRTYVKDDNNDEQRRRRELREECELKEAQMKDLEAKLTAAKGSCQKQQSRLMQITSIAEARATIKHLHSLVVNARVEEYERREEVIKANRLLQEEQKRIRELEERTEEMARHHDNDITEIEQHNHEKVIFLTKQLNSSNAVKNQNDSYSTQREEDLAKQLKIQAELIEDLSRKVDEKEAEVKPKKKSKPKSTAAPLEEFLESSESESENSDDHMEYVPTPVFRRFKRRSKLHAPIDRKEKGCGCKKNHCENRVCTCRKMGLVCRDVCGCDKSKCKNMTERDMSDVSKTSTDNSTVVQNDDDDTPYYERVSSMFTDGSEEEPRKRSLDSAGPRTGYKPIYFTSPLQEVDINSSEEVVPQQPDDVKIVQKKRKLYSVQDLL